MDQHFGDKFGISITLEGDIGMGTADTALDQIAAGAPLAPG
jgi:hypothetical protein